MSSAPEPTKASEPTDALESEEASESAEAPEISETPLATETTDDVTDAMDAAVTDEGGDVSQDAEALEPEAADEAEDEVTEADLETRAEAAEDVDGGAVDAMVEVEAEPETEAEPESEAEAEADAEVGIEAEFSDAVADSEETGGEEVEAAETLLSAEAEAELVETETEAAETLETEDPEDLEDPEPPTLALAAQAKLVLAPEPAPEPTPEPSPAPDPTPEPEPIHPFPAPHAAAAPPPPAMPAEPWATDPWPTAPEPHPAQPVRPARPMPQPLPPTHLPERLAALDTLVDVTEDRLTEATTAELQTIAGHVRTRLALSPEHVIGVFAGATGSGKSSLFNALLRFELSPIGPIRPTTLTSMACIWDPDRAPGAAALLDRIGVEERFRTLRGSLLDGARRQAEPELAPLVLVDLPDHDSAIRAHREETDRATALADLLLFVTDPQKYADASWHDRYLKNLTHHQDALAVILNKADELSPADARACAEDCRRLLDEAGLKEVPLIVTSTLTGEGLAELRSLITDRVWRKEAALQRSAADLQRAGTLAARELEAQGEAPNVSDEAYAAALTRISDGTGMDALADLVETTYRRRASSVTGWPLRHGLAALRSRGRTDDGGYLPWTSPEAAEPTPPPVQRGDVEAAVGQVVADAAKPLPEPWARRTRGIADNCVRQLADTLDATLGGTEVGPRLIPRWWTAVQVVHWMLLTAVLVGFSGTIVLGLTGESTSLPKTSVPFPALIALLALALGAALDLGSQIAARRAAARLRQRVLDRMSERVTAAVEQLLFAPLKAERERYLRALRLIAELKS